jgi:C4-dicarboxylate transporter DctM subunit
MVGRVTGSLGMVTVLACMFLRRRFGSAPATVAAIGTIMIPHDGQGRLQQVLRDRTDLRGRWPGRHRAPEFPMVLYGVTCNVSIGDLFIAGIGPALWLAPSSWSSTTSTAEVRLRARTSSISTPLLKSLWDAKAALVMPVIILGGIYGGVFTATEAAVVSTVYGIIIGLFVYKELKFIKLWEIFKDNASHRRTMFIMAPARATGSVFAYLGVNESISNFLFSVSNNQSSCSP